jgi:hypothetical protein
VATAPGRCAKRPRYLWQGGSGAAVVQFPAGKALTVRSAAGVFLGSLGNPIRLSAGKKHVTRCKRWGRQAGYEPAGADTAEPGMVLPGWMR